MRTFIDFDDAPVFAIPATGRCVDVEGILIEGPQGWGEFSPPVDCDAATLARWLTAAMEPGTVGWPDPVRGRVAVAVTVPEVDAITAHRLVLESRCRAADIVVGGDLDADVARVAAVFDALGPDGAVRVDARGRWSVSTAVEAISALSRVGTLEFVARPCATFEETTAVRRALDVRIAVDATAVTPLTDVADVAVLRVGALGGVRRAMRIAEASRLSYVVAAEPQSSVGLAGAVALAGALPECEFACAVGTLAGDVVAEARSLRPVGGQLPVAPMPPAPDAELISRYAMVDSARIAWWRDRLNTARTHGEPRTA